MKKQDIKSTVEVDHSVDYTGRKFRDVNGKMWTCRTNWGGSLNSWITATNYESGKKFSKDFEACDIKRFEIA